MALPFVFALGAPAISVDPITPGMPAGIVVDDALVFAVTSRNVPAAAIAIADQGGGTWSQVGVPHAGNVHRLTVFLSRYNGTQTAPTTTDTGDHQNGRIIAIRGCDWSSGTALNAEGGAAPTFPETVSAITAITTTVNNVLVLDIIAGEQPDADGVGVFDNWTNANLAGLAEVFDTSTSVGLGSSLAINAGAKSNFGDTGVTNVSHGNWRVAYKKLALAGTSGPTPRFARNARGQVEIDGVPRIPLLIYDSGGTSTSDMPAHLVTRDMGRFTNKLDIYNNVHIGTFGNALRTANALAPYNMFALATGNSFGIFDVTVPPPGGFDVLDNPTVTVGSQGPGLFRDLWEANPRALGSYLFDEPSNGGFVSGTGARTVYTIQGRLYTEAEITVFVAGVPKFSPADYTLSISPSVAVNGVQPPNYTVTFVVPPPSGTFNVQIKRSTVFDSILFYNNLVKTDMPTMMTFGTFLNGDLNQYIEYGPQAIGDCIGSDIYVIGQGPESSTGTTYGYMNFNVGETAAMARYYGLLNNKVSDIILQLNHFGGTSRFITASEIRSHCIAALTEFKGRGIIGWWAMGTQNGAIHQEGFTATTSNGTQTVYGYNSLVLDAADVWVDVNGVRLATNQFTVNGVGQITGLTVTLNVAPPLGQSVVVTNRSVGLPMRETWLSTLETLTTMIKDLESIMLTPDNPALITNNSTWFPTAIAWRINLLQLLSLNGTDVPTWLFGLRQLYQAELARLQQASPDTSLSEYVLDQRGDVRTASWEVGNTGLVTAYNMHPDPRTATFTWHSTISRVEVLGEGRDVPVVGGDQWIDTFGGGSALRQGPNHQGHVYRITLNASATIPVTSPAALSGALARVSRGTILKPAAYVRGT